MNTYNKFRRKTRTLSVGGVKIGGVSPLTVQSMTNQTRSIITRRSRRYAP